MFPTPLPLKHAPKTRSPAPARRSKGQKQNPRGPAPAPPTDLPPGPPPLTRPPVGSDRPAPYNAAMRFLHSMIRVRDLDGALDFFCTQLGLKEVRRRDSERGRFTLVFLETGADGDAAQIELTYNWDQDEPYTVGRNFGHLAFEVDDIYATCAKLQEAGTTIVRPPRDGRMAFVRSPDQISVELLQKGDAKEPAEPWASMPSVGEW